MFDKWINPKKHPEGVTLLLVVLILSIVSSIALGVTFLIMRQLQQGGDVRAELTAQNQADTGVERILYKAKMARGSGTNPDAFTTEMSTDATTGFPCNPGDELVPTFCVQNIPATTGETSLTTSLTKDQSTTVDFYDPTSVSGVSVQALELSGITDAATWLEVSWVGWTTTNGQIEYQSSATKTFFSGSEISGGSPRRIYFILGSFDPSNYTYFLNNPLKYGNCSEASPTSDTDCLVFPNNTSMNYIVRIKALYGSVPVITIRGLNNCTQTSCLTPTAQPLPSRATLKVIGKSGSIQQALQVSIPWRTSLAGLYDYVLFSANPLNRSEAVAPIFYTSGPVEAEQGATIAQSNGSICTAPLGTVCSPWTVDAVRTSHALCTYNNTINASGNVTCFINNVGQVVYPLNGIAPTDTSSGSSSFLNYRVRVHASQSDEKLSFSLWDPTQDISTASPIPAFDETLAGTSSGGDPNGNQSVDGWEMCTSYGFSPTSDKSLIVIPNPNNHTPELDWFSITSYAIVKAGTCSYSSN